MDSGIKSKQHLKLKRMGALITILSRYGFRDVLARMNIKNTAATDANSEEYQQQPAVYTRIRMVLEELGPTFVKLGQALSNREDVLPKELITELQQLQDKVELSGIDVLPLLEDHFGPEYCQNFEQINTVALASASIAQVYRATLKTGEQVVLKIKRPHIDEVIEGDLLLMKDLAKMLTNYFDFAERMNLEQAVSAFERSLMAELSFVNERENIERFAINFKSNKDIYVPKVYPYLSSNEVLCMEYIDGAKITDKAFHQQHHLLAAELADKGLHLYLKQILDYGFFHADPHAGNIMLLPDGRFVFIDMGAMGIIYPADQELLEDIVVNLITRNVHKLVAILKKMAVRIEIKDEKKLHDGIAEILTLVNDTSLENLNIIDLINKFKDILFENRIIMPDYFTLLVRGLMLIESVGRTLNPDMNIIKSVEPYVYKILQKRVSPQYLFNKGVSLLGDFSQDIQKIPYELRDILLQLHDGKLTFNGEIKALHQTNQIVRRGIDLLVLAIVLGALLISTAILILAGKGPIWQGLPVLGWWGISFSALIGFVLLVKIWRR